jgi:hypothetical protein
MSSQANRPMTGQLPVIVSTDPARRPDVLLRRRLPDGHQVSAWWMIGGFVGTSAAVIGLMNFFPGGQ